MVATIVLYILLQYVLVKKWYGKFIAINIQFFIKQNALITLKALEIVNKC